MIHRKYSKRKRRWFWGFNERVPTPDGIRRKRMYQWDTREAAQRALDDLQGLGGDSPRLDDLIRHKVAGLTRQNEISRASRVLITWLSLLDPSVSAKERDVAKVRSRILVTSIDTPKVTLYGEKRKQEVCPASVRRELVIIAATLHAAATFFPGLAQWRPPKVVYPKIDKPRRERVISQEEYHEILSYLLRDKAFDEWPWQYYARLRVGYIFQFAMGTGMRHGEIAKLQWTDIDWDSTPPKLIIFQTKTGKYKHIPITEGVKEILKARRTLSRNSHIFSDSDNPQDGGNIDSDFYEIFGRACEKCGIAYGKNTPGGLILHDARHTVTTRLADSGLNLDAIKLITGHTDKTLVLHYTHYNAESIKQAAQVLESHTAKPGRQRDTKKRK